MRESHRRCDKHNFTWKETPHIPMCPMCEHEEKHPRVKSRKINRLWWICAEGQDGRELEKGEKFVINGDWIDLYKDGVLLRRYNQRFIASIEWEDE